MTRLALVGAGPWGRTLLPALKRRFEVAACCTRGGAEGAAWLAAEHPTVPHTTGIDVLLRDESLDAVVIATPVGTHAELAGRSLRAGKHVFVEKPLATSVRDAATLGELAEHEKRVLFAGHVYLYHPLFGRLDAETRDDPVRALRLTWRKHGTFGSDILWNLVSHDVSIALALMRAEVHDVELLASAADSALVRLRFGGDREALIDVDRRSSARLKEVDVLTERGRTLVWRDESLSESGTELASTDREPLDTELEAFQRAIEDGEPFPSDARHALAVVDTIERARSAVSAA